jgi:hypothetical protein
MYLYTGLKLDSFLLAEHRIFEVENKRYMTQKRISIIRGTE